MRWRRAPVHRGSAAPASRISHRRSTGVGSAAGTVVVYQLCLRWFGRERLERLNWRNRELFFVRNVTDPLLVATHALSFGWNLRKHARLLGLSLADGVLAALATLPRLPRALAMRTLARRHYRRSDRQLLAAVNRG